MNAAMQRIDYRGLYGEEMSQRRMGLKFSSRKHEAHRRFDDVIESEPQRSSTHDDDD